MPLLLLLFHQMSWLAFPVNLIAIPWFSLVLVPLTFIAMMLWLIWPPLGTAFFGWIAPLFSGTLAVLEFVAIQAGGLVELAQRPIWALWLAALGALWLLLPLRMPAKPLALFLFLPLLPLEDQALAPGEWEWVTLDVGQGLAQIVRTQHHLLLYDAGPAFSKDFNAGDAVVVPYLKSRGLTEIDRMILSHQANDHVGGAQAVVDALTVGEVMGGGGGVPCRAGDTWHWDGVDFQVLHPDLDGQWQGNNASCVLLVQNGDRRLLLTGDLEGEGERLLLEKYPHIFPLSLVQVGHHGSRTSSISPFVQAASPALAVISSGYRNRYGFPAKGVVQQWHQVGARVVDTQSSGAIRVLWHRDQQTWDIQQYRETMQRFWRTQ
jgi:competence protein ComEC